MSDEKTDEKTEEQAEPKRGLPYGADYAKTGRSKCKNSACGEIAEGDLRMATRTQSRFFEGLQDNWLHFDCFWQQRARRGINEALIKGFEHLRWDDQQKIMDRVRAMADLPEEGVKAHAKVEYAKSGKSQCFKCKEKIESQAVRIGFRAVFYHPACLSEEQLYKKPVEDMDNFDQLEDSDKESLRDLFRGPDENKKKDDEPLSLAQLRDLDETEKTEESSDQEEDLKVMKKQTDLIWEVKDVIHSFMDDKKHKEFKTQKAKKEFIEELITYNNGSFHKKDTLNDHIQFLADMIVFGGFEHCAECDSGKFYYSDERRVYKCRDCAHSERHPKNRVPFKINKPGKNTVLAQYDDKIMLPEGRVFTKAMETQSDDKLILIVKPDKEDEPARKRKKGTDDDSE